ncbi:MAG: beta-hydroxyacyl-ACP dehydratase [Phycisphaerae bacterium]|nr:beta-hydroxyacyl-ACP dehydratase [Phycisphaerae bacterium]
MPVQQLFDISGIEKSAVFADGAGVGRVNPQAGHMRHLDHIIWCNSELTEVLGVKFVRHDEFWVPGHIPGRPLFPGVLQIEAGAQVSSFLQRTKYPDLPFIGFTRCDETAFRGQVVPGDTLYLLAKEITSNRRRFSCFAQGIVNDKIVFEAKISGMAI